MHVHIERDASSLRPERLVSPFVALSLRSTFGVLAVFGRDVGDDCEDGVV